ncbi:hypothetical protein [Amycolatopsis rubida]|uniref:hypothetical protein n=1 Tax=Amycolatopsis rubida TaxID=112413 RepID=UPI0011605448|nr:hypothetical protein [Amycolatopsis rubida]
MYAASASADGCETQRTTTTDAAALSTEELETALRRYALRADRSESAAINLLIDDKGWLRRKDFLGHAVGYEPESKAATVLWQRAADFLDHVDATPAARAILRVAVALGRDDLGILSLGPQTGSPVIRAVSRAIGHNA